MDNAARKATARRQLLELHSMAAACAAAFGNEKAADSFEEIEHHLLKELNE
jgi:hypothetical protein